MRSDLRKTRYFVATAETLHFRRAAERLGIAQPALSRAIRDLEAELGLTLFRRTNRNVRLTKAGTVFLDGCRTILSIAERTVEEARHVGDGADGMLRIGYTDFAIAGVVPELLKSFQQTQPDIKLKPMHHTTIAQLRALEDRALDFGFVTGPIHKPGYDTCIAQSEALMFVCGSSHPLAARHSIRLAELAGEDFVHGTLRDWEHFHDHLLPLCRRAGFAPNFVQEAYNAAGILGLVACGVGVTVLTERICAALGPGLVAIPFSDVPERLQTTALWRVDDMRGPKRLFVDMLRARPAPDIP